MKDLEKERKRLKDELNKIEEEINKINSFIQITSISVENGYLGSNVEVEFLMFNKYRSSMDFNYVTSPINEDSLRYMIIKQLEKDFKKLNQ